MSALLKTTIPKRQASAGYPIAVQQPLALAFRYAKALWVADSVIYRRGLPLA